MAKQLMRPSLLQGDNTVPGVKVPKEIRQRIPGIIQACRDYGLDFYDTIVEFLNYDEMSEVASYGGFPTRYPHWRWGMEYEEMSKGYEHGMYRIYEMVVNCLKPNTPVSSNRGTIPASTVKNGDILFTGSGSRKVVAVVKQKASKLLNIKLKNGMRTISCTPNHKWMVLTEKGLNWVETKNIKAEDIIIGGDTYPHYKNSPAKFDWTIEKIKSETYHTVRNRVKDIENPKKMTLNLAEFTGALLGDGSCGVSGAENALSICVDKTENVFEQHLVNLSLDIFGEKSVTLETHRDSVNNILINRKAAVDFMDYIGVKKGCTYKTKRIPWSIWQSSSEYRAAFIRGLFDTDGYATDVLGMSAYNHEFALDVQLLLAEMGITSDVDIRKNNDGFISVLLIQGRENLFKFRDRIGFRTPHKMIGLEKLTDTNNCVGKGHTIPYIQQKIVELAKTLNINAYTETSLGRSVYAMTKNPFGKNALYGFILRAIESGYEEFVDLFLLIQKPMYVVDSVSEGEESETIDIALDHDDHDFLANGLLSHNTNPCYLYCLDSNTIVDHVTVIAHALGHNDFFKNNIFFSKTDQNMMNELANHGTRIRNYGSEWGPQTVGRFIDKILSIDTLIDPASAWKKREVKDPVFKKQREYAFPRRLKVEHDYMENWINTPEFREQENKRIQEENIEKYIGIFNNPTRDIFGFIKDNAPLLDWQQDVLAMLYEEALYFAPQRQTKTINEGWASTIDSAIMARLGMAEGSGIFDYALHKAGVLGGKTSMNPYKLGYQLFMWIEECWNKGKFGREYEDCEDILAKQKWDKQLGLGHEKIFEVRKYYNDVTMIAEFFDQEFCDKYEFFRWERRANGEYVIVDRDAEKIKYSLLRSKMNGGLPEINLVDPNHKGKRILLMKHTWDGRILLPNHTKDTLLALSSLWSGPTAILSKNKDEEEIMYYCEDGKVEITKPSKV